MSQLINPLGEEIQSEEARAEAAQAALPAAKELTAEDLRIVGIMVCVECGDGVLRKVKLSDSDAHKTMAYLQKNQNREGRQLTIYPNPLYVVIQRTKKPATTAEDVKTEHRNFLQRGWDMIRNYGTRAANSSNG